MLPKPTPETGWSRELLDVLIRAGLTALLLLACYAIFRPFLNLLVWSIILAITLYPLQTRLRHKLGNREGWTATVIVTVVIIILIVPIYLMGASMAASVQDGVAMLRSGKVHIPPPGDSVATWPLVGEKVHAFWTQAATDLTSLAAKFAPQIKAAGIAALGALAGFGISLLMFIFALILAGVFMAFAEGGTRSAVQIASRIFGRERGPQVAALCTATIRAVAQGVIGIAFIQMLLIGVGFIVMGVPGAGILSIAVLLLGIAQIPATLITVPVIILVIATQGATLGTIIFAVYVFLAGLSDNVLKPLLLGRGVDVPMPVVLIGAIGGMITSGTIGLFIGPVLLAVAYQLFWQWVATPPEDAGRQDVSPT
ncbi:MAG: AI-2E family transporter [Acetobacteraceae bacterium]|nr:MAG: AI-2E family transporter [Acetobacteraceae bacterium]